jgi:type IV pilus assembly protein PilB
MAGGSMITGDKTTSSVGEPGEELVEIPESPVLEIEPEEDEEESRPPEDKEAGESSALLDRLKTPSIDLSLYIIEEAVARKVPEEMARRHKLVPVFEIGDSLTVAMADPLDVFAIDEVQAHTGLRVEPVLAKASEVERVIEQYLGDAKGQSGGPRPASREDEASSASILNNMLAKAIKQGASDVHIEPEEDFVRVRQRVDGVLKEIMTLPKSLESTLVTRVKILAKLDIAEKRVPQDGRIQLKVGSKQVDIRVSVQPTVVGENVVLRLLDRESILRGTSNLGLDRERQAAFEEAIQRPFGMILVTGPTGSGKTTTLYSALSKISSTRLNIMTIEDPVEYRLDLIRQTQVNPVAGYTFANGLRALLRQDPDVIMVGEIRDGETAEIAIRSALTGHLVFSTLHTNDSSGAFTRLIDMGIEPFLVASSVHCVIAQRLVRVICEKCKRPVDPPDYLVERLNIETRGQTFYQGKGCRVCHETGYLGRTGIFEVLSTTNAIRDAVMRQVPSDTLRQIAIREGMETLRQDGLRKAREGKTTLEEVLRVTTAEEAAESEERGND